MGDFNYPGINWEQLKADDLSSQHFLKLVMNCFLDQHVHTPTRENNILDLVLTSELEIRDEINVVAPIDCDHNVLIWEIECNNSNTQCYRIKLRYNQADYEGMRQFVRNKLQYIDTGSVSATMIWTVFIARQHTAADARY